MKISVIIPTLARPTLFRAVRSFIDASRGQDAELVIVGDGVTEEAIRTAAGLMGGLTNDPRFRVFSTEATRCWGAHQYDVGMIHAEGDWAMFLPDDDMLTPDSIEAVRKHVEASPSPVHIFAAKMAHWGGRVLQGSVRCCEVTASQLVIPLAANKLWLLNAIVDTRRQPLWADNKSQTFDHAYISAILDWYAPTEPVFHSEVINIADQQNNGRVF